MLKRINNILENWNYQAAYAIYSELKEDCYTKRMLVTESFFNTELLRTELESFQASLLVEAKTPGPSFSNYKESVPAEVSDLQKEKSALYKQCLSLKASLLHLSGEQERLLIGLKILKKWDRLYEIWEHLDVWKETGSLPVLKDTLNFDRLKGMSVRKVIRLEENHRTYIQRFKNTETKKEEVARRMKEIGSIKTYLDNAII